MSSPRAGAPSTTSTSSAPIVSAPPASPAVPASPAPPPTPVAQPANPKPPSPPVPHGSLTARTGAVVAFTGTDVIVWGGSGKTGTLADGARYNVRDRRWAPVSTSPLSPRADALHAWTGHRLVVWGGSAGDVRMLVDGAVYDPATNRWSRTADAPVAFVAAHAVWTAGRLVVCGATPSSTSECEIWQEASNTWSVVGSAPASVVLSPIFATPPGSPRVVVPTRVPGTEPNTERLGAAVLDVEHGTWQTLPTSSHAITWSIGIQAFPLGGVSRGLRVLEHVELDRPVHRPAGRRARRVLRRVDALGRRALHVDLTGARGSRRHRLWRVDGLEVPTERGRRCRLRRPVQRLDGRGAVAARTAYRSAAGVGRRPAVRLGWAHRPVPAGHRRLSRRRCDLRRRRAHLDATTSQRAGERVGEDAPGGP